LELTGNNLNELLRATTLSGKKANSDPMHFGLPLLSHFSPNMGDQNEKMTGNFVR
jgi:hypothetical protein